MKKRTAIILLALTLCTSLTACGGMNKLIGSKDKGSTKKDNSASVNEEKSTEKEEKEEIGDGTADDKMEVTPEGDNASNTESETEQEKSSEVPQNQKDDTETIEVKLENKQELKFEVGGKQFEMPCKTSELLEIGFDFGDEESKKMVLKPYEYTLMSGMENADGVKISLSSRNTQSEGELSVYDCNLGSITFRNNLYGEEGKKFAKTLVLSNGVKLGITLEQFEAVFTNPDEVYDGDTSSTRTWKIKSSNGAFDSSIKYSFYDGVLGEIMFTCYD